MKIRLLTIVLALLSTGLSAQTLGQATQEVRDSSQTLITECTPQVDSWGEQTALDDLRLVHETSATLFEALAGSDAAAVKDLQQKLSSAARRLKTSQTLLPADHSTRIAELETHVAAIEQRLTELRQRFDQKATITPGPLAGVCLSSQGDGFAIYQNPPALLIDVRDARRLCEQLAGAHYPGLGVGLGQPNNLDSLQLRRLVLAGWALERALDGQFSDISQVTDKWTRFHREYDRIGYPGNNNVTRQLERVMDRLTSFFDDVTNVNPGHLPQESLEPGPKETQTGRAP